MKKYLAILTIALSTTVYAATAYLIGQRDGTSPTGAPVKICTYGGPQNAELLVEPFAVCPPSIGEPDNHTGGYTAAVNAQSQRALQDAQTKLIQAETKALEAQRAQKAAQPKVLVPRTEARRQETTSTARTDAATWPSTPEQQAYLDQWSTWLKRCLDFCAIDEKCSKLCTNSFAHSMRCAMGDSLACDDRDRDSADLEAYSRRTGSK